MSGHKFPRSAFPMRVEWLDADGIVLDCIEEFGLDDAFFVTFGPECRYTRITTADGRLMVGPPLRGYDMGSGES